MSQAESVTSTRAASDPYAAGGDGTRAIELLEAAERYNAWLFSWLEPHLGARCVELGAGTGTLTRFALERHDVLACEPSTPGRQAIGARFAGHPRLLGVVGEFAHVGDTGAFDAVYSANVLEHISDDVSILCHAAKILRPGGRFAAVVPAGAWLYSQFDALVGHWRRYTRGDRIRLTREVAAKGLPLRLIAFENKNPIGALGWALKMRWGKQAEIRGSDVERVERLVPWLRRIDALPVPFGQSVLLVCERT